MDAAVRLASVAYDNRQIYVPAGNVRPDHRLARVLAPDELRTLQRHFGGELLPFPTLKRARRERASQIKQLAIAKDIQTSGLTQTAIALKHGVTKQWVARIARKIERGL